MNENIIAWNVTNMITITLIALVGFGIIGAGQKWYQNRNTPVSSN